MKSRFEMPLSVDESLKRINLFAVDDFLRLIQDEAGRQKIIRTVGYSNARRTAYEKKHQLPRGAVELAIMLEDRRFKELNAMITKQLADTTGGQGKNEELAKMYQEAASVSLGLTQLYPEAQNFITQYSLLTQRNRQQFLGDQRFSSEYRMQMVSSWCPSLTPVNCNIVINLGILLNVAVVQNIAAAVNVGAAVLVVLWLGVCVFAAVWAAAAVAFYGPNIASLRERSC